MKTKYKHVHFIEKDTAEGCREVCWTGVNVMWTCHNNRTNDKLGAIEKFWGQYEFSGTEYACFTAGCLRDIADFMEKLKDKK